MGAARAAVGSMSQPVHLAGGLMMATAGKFHLVPAELPERPLKPRDVRVAVKAVGVNPVDWKLGDSRGVRLAHGLFGPPGAFVCGIDFAGVVSEIGRAAQGVAVGDAVVGGVDFTRRQRGSYATEVVVRDTQLARLPADVDLQAAACLPVAGVVAHQALFAKGGLAALRSGKVLILGASGGVGHLALQLARNGGASVFGVCSVRNAPMVMRLGAVPVTHDDGDALDKARAHGPFDVVVNAVNTTSYPVRRVGRLLSRGGRQVLLNPSPLDYPCLALPSVKTLNVFPTRQTLEPLVHALAHGTLDVVIGERFPLEQAELAHRRSRSNKVVGKLVLVVDEERRPGIGPKPRNRSGTS